MGFIKFKDVNRSHAAKVSISQSGTMSFNDGARRRFNMDENRFCVLYHDPEFQKVGIEFTTDETAEGAKNIRLRLTGADISAKAFLDFFEIKIGNTMLYDLTKDGETGWGMIELLRGKARKSKRKQPEEEFEEITEH